MLSGVSDAANCAIRLGSAPAIQSAAARFSGLESWIEAMQLELTAVAAPTGREARRAAWMCEALRTAGLAAELDEAGNVVACHSGWDDDAAAVLVSAHLDTAFPHLNAVVPERRDGRLYGPGIGDNGAGLAALLALARVIEESRLQTRAPILFVANVGEEGEGDLQGMRYLFESSAWRDRIGTTIVIDGPGCEHITNHGLASRRLKILFEGPGGHSWSNAGTASAVHAAARTAALLVSQLRNEPGRTAWNLGSMEGGHAVNAIAEAATLKIDLRSTDLARLAVMAERVHAAAVQGAEWENAAALQGTVRVEVVGIGERPAGRLGDGARVLSIVRAVDMRLGLPSQLQCASTDANVPLSLGREAVCLGAGGHGGGAHTMQEWFDPRDREVALRRVLLTVLAIAGWGEERR